MLSEADVQGYALREDQLERGNVDQPDAYRGLPIDEKEVCLAALSCFHDLIWPSVFKSAHTLFSFKPCVMHYLFGKF